MTDTTFSNTLRIKDKSFSKRVGNNLLRRDSEGRVTYFIEYFSPSQILARKLYAKRLQNSLDNKRR